MTRRLVSKEARSFQCETIWRELWQLQRTLWPTYGVRMRNGQSTIWNNRYSNNHTEWWFGRIAITSIAPPVLPTKATFRTTMMTTLSLCPKTLPLLRVVTQIIFFDMPHGNCLDSTFRKTCGGRLLRPRTRMGLIMLVLVLLPSNPVD